MKLPISLPPNEKIILEGGMAKTYLAIIIPGSFIAIPSIFLPPLGFLMVPLIYAPYFFSGNYWLTNQNLYWKPRWRSLVTIPLSMIDERSVKLGLGSSFMKSLKFADQMGKKHTLRFISNLEKLWGALVDKQELLVVPVATNKKIVQNSTTSAPVQALVFNANISSGLSTQKGVCILRDYYVAFIPTEAKFTAFRLILTIILAIFGVVLVSQRAQSPLFITLNQLLEQGATTKEFDRKVLGLVLHRGLLMKERSSITSVQIRGGNTLTIKTPEGTIAGLIPETKIQSQLVQTWLK